ncbi:hypothetical protein KP509_23G053000 [Ceratopteris richardii]|uniref:FAS1 domain-containing protein n=1 Tax=Ceratopteris richardii TaxID=49495 RepID=A0A8T2RZW4_CERRI|nr:hypothetical protein KP509_23G053000 [Ceratopteris richardii]
MILRAGIVACMRSFFTGVSMERQRINYLLCNLRALLIPCLIIILTNGSLSAQTCSGPDTTLSKIEVHELLGDLNYRKFCVAASALANTPRATFYRNSTLLVPSDEALMFAFKYFSDYRPDLALHTLAEELSYDDLRRMPNGTWIPSKLPNFGVHVTENQGDVYTLNEVPVVAPNICPNLVQRGLTCHGIDGVLDPLSPFSRMSGENLAPISPPDAALPPSALSPLANSPTPSPDASSPGISPDLPLFPLPPPFPLPRPPPHNIVAPSLDPSSSLANLNSSSFKSPFGIATSILGPASQPPSPNSAMHTVQMSSGLLILAIYICTLGYF